MAIVGIGSGGTIVTDDRVVLDKAIDVATTALASHTPENDSVGGGWITPYTQVWQINTQKEFEPTSSWGQLEPFHAYIDSGIADVMVYARLRGAKDAGSASGLIIRSVPDSGTPLDTSFLKVDLYNGSLYLKSWDVGSRSETTLNSTAVTHTTNYVYPVWCTAVGTTITVHMFDDVGEQSFSHTTSLNQASTLHGMFANATSQKLTDFVVTPE